MLQGQLSDSERFGAIEVRAMVSGIKQSFTEAEKDCALATINVIKPFLDMNPTFPLQLVLAYLLVVLDEGETVNTYAEKAGISPSLMTRHLLDLSERNRAKGPGYSLIVHKSDPMDLRIHRKVLSDTGRALFHQIIRAIRGVRSKA